MRRFIIAAITLLSLSANVHAFVFDPITHELIALEATENISGDALEIVPEAGDIIPVGGRIVLSVSGGATFANTAYSLESWQAGAGNGNLSYATLTTATPSGASSIEFVMSESDPNPFPPPTPQALADVEKFILSGDSIAGQAILFNLPQTPGVDIYLNAEVFDSIGTSLGTASLLMFESSLEAPAAPLPASGLWSQALLLFALAIFGAVAIRRRKSA